MSNNIPENLKYTKDHEWVLESKGVVTVGVTAYAVEQLGDIVHIELPEMGAELDEGDPFGTIESTKTVSDLYMPVSGEVVEINDGLESSPESLQESSYDDGWIVKIKPSKAASGLMTATEYQAFISE